MRPEDVTAKVHSQAAQPLTPLQKQALARLHAAATQLEGVFMQMLMSAMQQTVPKESIFGQQSTADDTYQQMLDDQRATAMAKSGNVGIARILEEQLRSSVLADASNEAKAEIPADPGL